MRTSSACWVAAAELSSCSRPSNCWARLFQLRCVAGQCLCPGLQVAFGVRQLALLGPDAPTVCDQRLLFVGERLGGGAEPLLGLLEFLAILGQGRSGFQGDAVALGLETGAQFGGLRSRCCDGALGLCPGIGPDLVGVPPGTLLEFVRGL